MKEIASQTRFNFQKDETSIAKKYTYMLVCERYAMLRQGNGNLKRVYVFR